jgi:hypothetical protein
VQGMVEPPRLGGRRVEADLLHPAQHHAKAYQRRVT